LRSFATLVVLSWNEIATRVNPAGPETLQQLQRNSHQLARELGNPDLEIHYALFSRSGFSDNLKQRAGEALLLTPEDLYA
jgi:hypothetical protein